jgi:N-acetylmuramoyl-L-alanine amidase
MRIIFLVIVLLLFSNTLQASVSHVKGLRTWASPDSTRLVIDLSNSVEHSLSYLTNPERVVIDLKNIKLSKNTFSTEYKKGVIGEIRSARKNKHDLRIVLDLNSKVRPKSFLLKPNRQYKHHRLVIDLEKVNKSASASPKVIKSVNNSKRRDIIVAIDAGHGGEDPGATGRRGSREKDIVLQIARKLRDLVNKKPGMKAVMIRNGDYYISLRGRTKKARKANADIFISIHADAFKNTKAHGSSVFILSSRGASSEAAKWLAKKENQADLVGGVSLDDKDDMLARLLLDLSQTATIEASNSVAFRVMKGLKSVGDTHKNSVERAGFAVLKSPDIPSLLVETGFISNPKEEKLLRSVAYQKKLAGAIFNGVEDYFKRYPPPGSMYAKQTKVKSLNTKVASGNISHKVVRGDTLSGLSKRYQVSITRIKKMNSIKNSTLHLGKVLTIPGT